MPTRRSVARGGNLALLLILQLAPAARAQEVEALAPPLNLHQWGAVTLFHGLPSDHVRAIAQDQSGQVWFGTDAGLARFDGRRTQTVAVEGLANAPVRTLRFDAAGALWIGTAAGAALMRDDTFTLLPETSGREITAVIAPEAGRALLASAEGEIFTCTAGDGPVDVERLGPDDAPLLSIGEGGGLPLTSLALVGDSLVAGTRGRGLLSIDGRTVGEVPSRPRAYFIRAVEVDPKGHAWFGAETSADDSGLYESTNLRLPQKIGAGSSTVTAIGFDEDDVWVGTENRGVFHYRGGREVERFSFEASAGGLRSNRIYSIFVDRDGVVWFGTDRGACRYDPRSPRTELLPGNAESSFVRAVYPSPDGWLWCGTNRGLFVRPPEPSAWQEVEPFTGRTVHSIARDATGRLLVGLASGLYAGTPARSGELAFERVDKGPDGPPVGDSVRAICEFRGTTYIASFGRGLERVDGSRRTLLWPREGDDPAWRGVVSLHPDGGRLLVGTAEAGVFAFDGTSVAPAPGLDALRGAAVWDVDGTEGEGLWFATERGLFAARGGALTPVVEGAGVRCVVAGERPGSAWRAGPGLVRVSLTSDGAPLTSRLDTEHGLPSENVFALARGGDALWIGTNKGLARYEPGRVAPALQTTRVLGKRVYQPEEVRAGLSLEYPQNSLVIEVAATSSRTFPEQFQYAFVVFDAAGKALKQRLSHDPQLILEGLRPGRYRVEARAFTNDLVSSEPLAFAFDVAPAPFPKTSAALSVLLAFALFAVWWGFRQNRKLARTNAALEGANRQLADTRLQLANETEAERSRISRDLHDQTLSDLRRLMMLTDRLPAQRGDAALEPATFRAEIESVSTEVRRICEALSPSVLANVGLTAALEWALADAVAHLPAGEKFEYEFLGEDGIEETMGLDAGVQIQIYRIVQEAISNVCRHAHARRVRLTAAVDEARVLVVALEDDGRGISGNGREPHMGRGLSNIRSRASLIEAEARWHARPEGGTIFTLRKVR